jgi:hypothetical protein
MAETYQCFWLEPTGEARLETMVVCSVCDHATRNSQGTVQVQRDDERSTRHDWGAFNWPKVCEACGHPFDFESGDDWRSSSTNRTYRRDTGEEGRIHDFGVGAMWDAYWMTRKGPDGRSLMVRLPGDHDWAVDSRASNCDQKEREHYCWVRHGEPPKVTAGKGSPGESCTAGAGSIWVDQPRGWHGFLRDGVLTT